jgi:nucleolin
MAAVSMTMAVASTRFAAVTARAEANFTRNGASLSMAAPVAGSSSVSCVFSEFGKGSRGGMNAAIVARASDLEQGAFGEVGTQEAEVEVEVEVDAPSDAAPVQQGSKLYVGNLPWSVDSSQLAEICQDFGTVEAVEVIYDQETGRSRGFAFVTMASNADAQAVINSLDGSDLGGRSLRVNYPQPKGERPRFERSERPERGAFGGERRRDDNLNKLFVGNLTWGCDESQLHQLFSDYGKVVEARIVIDRDTGRSKGYGFVTLESASEVNSAIESLDGADFEGRQLRVNMAGDKPPRREF